MPNMKKTGLPEALSSLKYETHEVILPTEEMDTARRILDRMISIGPRLLKDAEGLPDKERVYKALVYAYNSLEDNQFGQIV